MQVLAEGIDRLALQPKARVAKHDYWLDRHRGGVYVEAAELSEQTLRINVDGPWNSGVCAEHDER